MAQFPVSAAAPLRSTGPARRAWVAPTIVDLPALQQLTLQSGSILGSCTPMDGCTFGVLPRATGEGWLPG